MNTKANNEIYTEDLLLQDKDMHKETIISWMMNE